MSLSNISQILLRNSALISASTPLFINLSCDDFIGLYIADNPTAVISCYNTHYTDYLAIQHKHNSQLTTHFTSEYKAKIKHDLVIINFPKSKDELTFTLAMIAPYLCQDAKVILVGEKKGGVQSSPKLTQHFLQACQKIDAARHCLLFAGLINNKHLNTPFILDDWFKNYQLNVGGINLTIASLPGVFSQQKLDTGTALLLANLPESMQGKVLDFGCGAGVISCFIGKKFPDTQLYLLDVNALALRSAQQSFTLNNLSGDIFASNSLSMVSGQFDHIVSNPPFHQGTKTHYQATEDFLRNIKKHMNKKSNLTIVANSFLKYLPIMKQFIGITKTLINSQGFTVYFHQKN